MFTNLKDGTTYNVAEIVKGTSPMQARLTLANGQPVVANVETLQARGFSDAALQLLEAERASKTDAAAAAVGAAATESKVVGALEEVSSTLKRVENAIGSALQRIDASLPAAAAVPATPLAAAPAAAPATAVPEAGPAQP